ncbi:MAG: hypothetical protein ACR2L2_15340 [Acidobacteriota bacterium]
MQSIRRRRLVGVILTFACAGFYGAAQEPSRSPRAIIKQVDHVMIPTSEMDQLYSLLSDTLRLPIVYAYQPWTEKFQSGLVCAGNVNLEALPSRPKEPSAESPVARFSGIAFEPTSTSISVEELAARTLEYAGPFPYTVTGPDGQKRTRWTTVGLRTLSRGLSAFLCEYNFDVEARRQVHRQELEKRDGGPIGLESVDEIILGTPDLDDAIARWQKVLDPLTPAAAGFWRIGNGPAIRLIQSDKNAILALVLKVKSLERAKSFLAANNLLGEHSDKHLGFDRSKVQGLDIRLVE